MIYLAAPYSHTNSTVREERMAKLYEYDATLVRNGKFTVSPLYKVEMCKQNTVPDDWEYWKQYSYELLSRCDSMHVLMLDGWQQSSGVVAEIEYCKDNEIPIEYINIS